jgi:hypothetical protein
VNIRTVQVLYSASVSLFFIVLVYRLGRKQKLSFRYTVGWMGLGVVGFLGALLLPLAAPVAGVFGVAPAALIGLAAIVLLVALCVQLSISISGIQEQLRKIAEELALFRSDVESDGKPTRQNDSA